MSKYGNPQREFEKSSKEIISDLLNKWRNKGFNFSFEYLYTVSVEDSYVLLKHRDNYDETTGKYITKLSHAEALKILIDWISDEYIKQEQEKESRALLQKLTETLQEDGYDISFTYWFDKDYLKETHGK